MLIKNNYKKTSNFFILNGTSEYNIILPCIAEEYEEKAAAELSCFLFRATGAQLKILYEDAVVEDGKYIFLGNLSANNEVKSSLSYKQLNKEGFVIVTKGENISIVGKSDRGTLFGVYKFLEKTVGYRYYGIEQINFNTEKDVPLYLFDWVEMPDIEARCLGHYEVFKTQYNPEYPIHTDRLRLARTAWTDWVMFAHTYFSIIPKDKYFETHRDFYSPDGGNLCLSNLELRKEFLKNLKQIITENEGDLVMIGQEDTFEFCDCPACKKRVEEDGNPAGLMMEFSNEIATEIKTWLAETNPERKLTLVTFAYNATAFPPVKYDKDLREYVPLKETYKAVDNLAVMVVPRGAAHSKSLFDEKFNKRVKEQLLGWKAVSKQLHIWTYCVNYDHFLINFNNIHALRENYQIYRDIGTTFLFDQGATNVRTPCFDMLRMFVQSELLWDTSLDTDALIDEFINAYYMELAPYMKEYFNKVFNRWKIIESKYGIQSYTGGGSTYYLRKDFWPKDFVDECMDLFRIMRGEIERFATIEEWDKYVLLRKRLYREWLSVRYLLLHLYGNYFGEDLAIKIKTFREDCKRYEVDPYNEGAEMIDIF